ncbi:hypothetical protein EJ04DRAFT_586655 [Polyplosphaeria fusca]|uniref:2EXR domain-containing protein n=1 Tax=Polyplosphaeria fusca TaxID=682080 RepID=A0A9P4UXC3_9PLEO|nr:hypothetical protein EJ04DRAFT_586655 [Polyplosphaeria fusca]
MATFHPFRRLATELRIQIWELTVEPRTVNIQVRHRDKAYRRGAFLTSSTPVPAVLQTCQEARNLGLYQKCFSELAMPDKGLGYVWANLDIDIIDVGECYFEDIQPIAPLIRRLRFKREISSEFFCHSEVNDLRAFENVEEIYIVCADGLYAWVGALEEHHWPCGEENVCFIDPNDGRIFRGPEGLDLIYEVTEQEVQQHEIQQLEIGE